MFNTDVGTANRYFGCFIFLDKTYDSRKIVKEIKKTAFHTSPPFSHDCLFFFLFLFCGFCGVGGCSGEVFGKMHWRVAHFTNFKEIMMLNCELSPIAEGMHRLKLAQHKSSISGGLLHC